MTAPAAGSTSGPIVQTVLGPIAPDQLGQVLHHEHLLSLVPGPWLSGGLLDVDEDTVIRAVDALRGLGEAGIGTVVDVSPYGVVGRSADGSNVELLVEISRRSGLHVVCGSAVYLESFGPDWAVQATVDELTERFIADVRSGIGSSSVRAGVLGEQATSLGRITDHERKGLRAAARAQVATGVSLITHTTHGTMALEQLAVLVEEGVDLGRVVIGHLDTHPDTGYVLEVLRRGANVAFDTIGKQNWDFRVAPEPTARPDGEFSKTAFHRSDAVRARRIAELVEAGFAERILLAHDLTGEEVSLNPGTHGQLGYRYLNTVFAAMLADLGVTSEHFAMMMRDNPARLLTVGSTG